MKTTTITAAKPLTLAVVLRVYAKFWQSRVLALIVVLRWIVKKASVDLGIYPEPVSTVVHRVKDTQAGKKVDFKAIYTVCSKLSL